jgi:hypothetical protein
MDDFADFLGPILDDYPGARLASTDQNNLLLSAILAYVALPGLGLQHASKLKPIQGDLMVRLDGDEHKVVVSDREPPPRRLSKPPPSGVGPPPRHIKQAATLMRRGNPPAAKRLLTSHGQATRDAEGAKRVACQFSDYGETLAHLPVSSPQIEVTAKCCLARMVKLAYRKNCSTDVFGWSSDLFFDDVNRLRDDGRPTLLVLVARLSALLATAELPPEAYLLLTASYATELNKVSAAAQQELADLGKPASTRPIAAGAEVTKVGLSVAKASKPARRVQRAMQPTQLGCGARDGAAEMAITAQALHLDGYAVRQDDKKSAFQCISRNTLHAGVAAELPEAYALTCALYGAKSPVFYLYFDSQRRCWVVSIAWNAEGPRQGCVWGSFLYCIATKPCLDILTREFPDVVVRAQCDDIIRAIKPAEGQTWDQAYERLADYIRREDELFRPMHLERHPEKCFLTLAPNAPPPRAGVLDVGGMVCQVVKGSVVSGAPFGDPCFIRSHAGMKAAGAAAKIALILLLADIEPHMALSLLANSSRAMLGYYWSLTPPDLCDQAYAAYDATIGLAIKCLLCPKGTSSPGFGQARYDRAVNLLRLPFFHSGADLVRSADDGPCLYTAKFIALTGNRSSYLHGKRALFSAQITAAHAIVVDGVGPSHVKGSPTTRFLPLNAKDLLSGPNAYNITRSFPKGTSGLLTRAVGQTRFLAHLRSTVEAANTDDESVTHQLAVLLLSQMSRVFVAPHDERQNRVPADNFQSWIRYHTNLPRHLGSGEIADLDGSDCQAETCPTPHDDRRQGAVIGPTAGHLFDCQSARGAIIAVHNDLRDLFHRKGIEAGCRSTVEPSAHKLLLYKYSPEVLRGLHPKKSSKEAQDRASKLELTIKSMERATDPEEKKRLQAEFDTLVRQIPPDTTSIRPDVQLIGHHHQERWIDVGIVHTSKSSTLAQVKRFMLALALTGGSAKAKGLEMPSSRQESPAVAVYAKLKVKKHMGLLHMSKAQTSKGLRKKTPVFSACVVSNTGEWSQGTIATIEWLCEQKRASLQAATRGRDPRRVAQQVAEFRTSIKDGIACTIARGMGGILSVGGHCFLPMSAPANAA